MTKEQIFFFQILSDHISQRSTLPFPDIDWDILFNMANIHQVEGIVYCQCKTFMPERTDFQMAFRAAAFYYSNRLYSLSKIESVFSQHNIPVFTVKGVNVAQYYPIPSLRTMGDADLIVHKQDMEKAQKVLLDIGFTYDCEFSGKEKVLFYQDMLYELHHSLVYDEIVTNPQQQLFFNNCWEYVNDGQLDHSFHFLFLIAHLRKHLMNEGVGFRMFLDIAVVGKTDKQLNWSWIEEELKQLELYRFAQTCATLIRTWLGIDLPIETLELEGSFIDRTTKMVFDNGVFGFNNKENINNSTINALRSLNGPRWLGRIIIILRRMFPSYKFLCSGDKYSFLVGRPYLLPAAWIYRFGLMVQGKSTKGSSIMKRIMVPDKKIASREEDLRRWGLLD